MTTVRDVPVSDVKEPQLNPALCRDGRVKATMDQQYQSMIQQLQESPLERFSAKQLKDFGLIYIEKSDYINAEKFFRLSLDKLQSESLEDNESAIISTNCYFGIATAERELGKNEQSIKSFRLSQSKCLEIKSIERSAISYDIERNLG